MLPHGVPPAGRSLACQAVAPSRAYQVALMRSSLRVCSVGARQSAEIVASRHGPSIAPHGRTVWSKRTPSATGRSRVHSCYGEGGGDHCCAHKEYAHQADNTVAKAISAADIISNPRSGETRVQAPLSLIACVSSRRYGCIMCSHGVGSKGIAWSGGAPTWATRKTDVHQ